MFIRTTAAALAAGLLWAGVAAAEVHWAQEPFDQALQRAKSEKKHVFIDFYTTWCGPCKLLEQTTYPDAGVSEFLNATIALKYDAEKGPGLPLAKRFKVVAYPTLILLDPSGNEVDRHLGYLPPDNFLQTMKNFLEGVGTAAYYRDRLEENPNDDDLLFALGMKHVRAVLPDEAEPLLSKAMELDPKDKKGRHAEILFGLGDVNYSAERYAEAKRHFERLVREHERSEWYEDGLKRLAATEHKLGNHDAAVTTYWKAVEPEANDPKALNGFAWFCAQRKIGLEKALAAALKAVELSNRDPGILDTLAEVHFARGDYDNAVQIGEEAAAKEPSDTYFKEQVEKFKKAKSEQARNR